MLLLLLFFNFCCHSCCCDFIAFASLRSRASLAAQLSREGSEIGFGEKMSPGFKGSPKPSLRTVSSETSQGMLTRFRKKLSGRAKDAEFPDVELRSFAFERSCVVKLRLFTQGPTHSVFKVSVNGALMAMKESDVRYASPAERDEKLSAIKLARELQHPNIVAQLGHNVDLKRVLTAISEDAAGSNDSATDADVPITFLTFMELLDGSAVLF